MQIDRGMDSHRSNAGASSSSSGGGSSSAQFLLNLNLFPHSLSTVLEVSGLIPTRPHGSGVESRSSGALVHSSSSERLGGVGVAGSSSGAAEVAITIIGDSQGVGEAHPSTSSSTLSSPSRLDGSDDLGRELASSPRFSNAEVAARENEQPNTRETNTMQRYDFQPLAKWVEQVFPFTVLLLLVFIRQHLEGLAVILWITAVMIKANALLRRQTALKGERKKLVTASIAAVLICHLFGVYWFYRGDAIWRPLILLPTRKIPKFWEAMFTIMVNDVMVRQAGMAVKCCLLLTCKSTRGRHFRKQGRLLTVVEYLLLLVRALIPGPVWYRFFLNKEYGNLFSSLTTGLYLTFKLTSVFKKVRKFIGAVRLVTRSEVQYGNVASADEILAAGDMCAICQEKMHSPICLRCRHIFCEDCVSEWFERERTCPLCRAVVKSANFRSFADGRTSLFFQIF